MKGKTCPCCSGKVVSDKNRVSLARPDLVKYFKNKEDSIKFSVGSHKKTIFVCPTCNEEYEMKISDLSRKPFSCKKCSDGVSRPEKFMFSLLSELNITFEYQKKFKWSENKVYDFYIPSINTIIETHGGFHYRNSTFNRRTLEEEQKNDTYKENLAKNNNIDKYIVVDCRDTSLKYLKASAYNSFINLLDLNSIKDWNKVYEFVNKNNIQSCSELYNKGYSLKEICMQTKMSKKTVRGYLRTATELKLCNYVDSFKCVYEFDIDYNFVSSFKTTAHLSRFYNIGYSSLKRKLNENEFIILENKIFSYNKNLNKSQFISDN